MIFLCSSFMNIFIFLLYLFLSTDANYNHPPLNAAIREKFNVPSDCPEDCQIIFVGLEAHMDWDWLLPFSELCSNNDSKYWDSVIQSNGRQILSDAITYMKRFPDFQWNIAEVAFLQDLQQNVPAWYSQLLEVKDQLRIVGGGLVSNDDELVHGESFIRNFLTGRIFLQRKTQYGEPLDKNFTTVWFPDNFGHDPQLPVILEAMGIDGVGFARIPGAPDDYNRVPVDGSPSWAQILRNSSINEDGKIAGGVDFLWTAGDNSTVIAHWLMDHYTRGFYIDGNYFGWNSSDNCRPGDGNCLYTDWRTTNQNVHYMFKESTAISPAPVVYIHSSWDFDTPNADSLLVVENWNKYSNGTNGYSATHAFAVLGSFEDYIWAISQYTDTMNARPFTPIPYWNGQYASRPFNKYMHHRISKILLFDELLLSILAANGQADQVSGIQETIEQIWNDFVPSMHHDFVTGTAAYYVYEKEQIPLLYLAQNNSLIVQQKLLEIFSNLIDSQNIQNPVTIFNSLGFDRQGIYEISTENLPYMGDICSETNACQVTENGVLMSLNLSSFGYETIELSKPNDPISRLPESRDSPDSITLENEYLSVIITEQDNWGISSIYDKIAGEYVTNSTISGSPANEILFYKDGGNLYKYGYEQPKKVFEDSFPTIVENTVVIAEDGPIRKTIINSIIYNVNNQSIFVNRTYSIVTGEYILRMSGKILPKSKFPVSGRAPNIYEVIETPIGYSIFIRYPILKSSLPAQISSLSRGTPYHHDSSPLVPYSHVFDFFSTQNFALALSEEGEILGGFYHDSPRAWAITKDKSTLYGTLLRNPSIDPCFFCDYNGNGYIVDEDPDIHMLNYAFRIPSSLEDATSMQPLSESLNYLTPVITTVPNLSSETLPSAFSLATITSQVPAMFTAAKLKWDDPNALILRMYQPTNNPIFVSLNINGSCVEINEITAINALELPLDQTKKETVSISMNLDESVNIQMNRAIVTLKVPLLQPN